MRLHPVPQRVVENCAAGLAAMLRNGYTSPPEAETFARIVTTRAQVTKLDVARVLEAHRALDTAIVEHGRSTPLADMTHKLWGGTEGRGFAETVIAQPEPETFVEPIAATAAQDRTDTPVGLLDADLARIDERLATALEAAVAQAYGTTMRSLSLQAVAALRRVPKKVRDNGFDMNQRDTLQAEMADQDPWFQWHTVPTAIYAALDVDQERALETTLTDLERTVTQIVDTHRAETQRTIAARLETEPAEIEPEIRRTLAARAVATVTAVVGGLRAFILSLTTTRDTLPPVTPEPEIVRTAVRTLAGTESTRPAQTVARTIIQRQRPLTLTVGYEWDYGEPSSRRQPYEPHQAVDQRRWLDGDASPDGQELGDHIGCQCRIRETTLLVLGSGQIVDPRNGEIWKRN